LLGLKIFSSSSIAWSKNDLCATISLRILASFSWVVIC
jgi:hypothetical protein